MATNSKDYGRQWRIKNSHRIPHYKKDVNGLTKDKYLKTERNRKYLRRYGLTTGQFNEMLERQNNLCFICGRPNLKGMILAVDHNHKTKQVRKLLCIKCNHGLGCFEENIYVMKKAIQYLKDHEKQYERTIQTTQRDTRLTQGRP